VRFVLRPRRGRADAHRGVERGIDLGRVVRGTVGEELRERRVASGLLAVFERLDDGGAVLFVPHADADRSVTRRVDDELEVYAEGLVATPVGGSRLRARRSWRCGHGRRGGRAAARHDLSGVQLCPVGNRTP
jgi:hypothetical protein